jgi:hypothetical protein
VAENVLRRHDFQTDLWLRLESIWSFRREDLRTRLCQPGISEREADHLRGRIEELSFNLSQPEYFTRAAERQEPIEPGDVSAIY